LAVLCAGLGGYCGSGNRTGSGAGNNNAGGGNGDGFGSNNLVKIKEEVEWDMGTWKLIMHLAECQPFYSFAGWKELFFGMMLIIEIKDEVSANVIWRYRHTF
jgi:hypothetical protein